jgi:hypothetical protein
MEITVLECLNKYSNRFHGSIYFKPFKGQIIKIEMSDLLEMTLSLKITNECVFLYEGVMFGRDSDDFFLVIEDEITYLRRRVKEQAIENKRLRDSLAYYRDALNEKMKSLFSEVIKTFMPRDFNNLNLHSTPLRRGIANALFFLHKRGHAIPEKYVAFMNRYATRKTTRR